MMKKHIISFFIAALCLFFSCEEPVVPVSSVTMDKGVQSIAINESCTVKAIVSPSNATNTKVLWTVENASVIEYSDLGDGSITVTGRQVGTSKVIARSDDGGYIASCEISVGKGVERIELEPAELQLKKGDSQTLTASIFPADATCQTLHWGTSDSKVASVDEDGKVTAVGNGSATVFVSSSDGGHTAYCNVYVGTPLGSLSLDPGEYTLESIGSSFKIAPVFYPEDATDTELSWTSADPKIASVSSDGTVTAIGPGTTAITAAAAGGAITSKCVVTVLSPALAIKISDSRLSLEEGEEASLSASVFPSDATQSTLTWRSDKPEVATVDQDGKVRAVKAGVAVITVSVSETVFETCTVTVVSRVTGISFDVDELEILPGESHQLNVTVLPENASVPDVNWSSDNAKVAKVSDTGLVTGHSAGVATIHAVTRDGGKMATCLVKVGTPVSGISLSKSSASMYVGDSPLALTAAITPSNASDKSVVWSSSDASVASVTAGSGLDATVTPVAAGTATITVSTPDGKFSASCVLTVKQHVTGVSISKSSLTLYTGQTETLSAQVKPEDATDTRLTWSSSDKTVATVANGLVTALKAGSTQIRVTSFEGGFQAVCNLTVKQHVTGLDLSASTLTINLGQTVTMTATVLPSDASDKSVTWTSSNSDIVSVTQNGSVTANAMGEAEITATSNDGGFSKTCKVTVVEPLVPATSLTLTPKTMSLNIGDSGALELQILPNDCNEKLKWESSDPSVATVNNGDIKALAAGTTTITVRGINTSASATVTVIDPYAVTGVTLDRTTLSLEMGETATLLATVLPEDARDKTVTWSSGNTAVATVDQQGKITTVSPGTAQITVTTKDGSFSASCALTVVERIVPITSISYAEKGTTVKMNMGESYNIRVKVSPDDATEQITVSPAINCPVVCNPTKETGTPYWNVLVTALYKTGTGAIFIDSASGNYSTQVMFSISKIAVTGIELDRTEATMRVGQTMTLTPTIAPSNASIKTVRWESSDSSVGYVSQSGIVTAKSAGKVRITARSSDNNAIVATCTILIRSTTVDPGTSEGVGFEDWN